MKNLILLLILVLAGCVHNPAPTINVQQKINIEAKYFEGCANLPTTSISTVEGALKENIELYYAYSLCARKQLDSIEIIKQIGAPL